MAAALTVMAALAAVAVFFVARAASAAASVRLPAARRSCVQLFLIATGGFLVQVDPRWLGVVADRPRRALTAVLIVLPPSTRALGVD